STTRWFRATAEARERGGLAMRGSRRVWILLTLLPGCVPAGAEIGGMSGGAPAIPADMVPDPSYRPRTGDRSVLYALQDGYPLDRLPLLKDLTAYDVYVRSQQARDGERLGDLERQGWLQWVPPGTRVLVVDMQDRNHTGAHLAAQVQVVDD